jgi:hypothetical protein
MSLERDILKKIKKDKIEPKAKWIFVLKNLLAWSLGILSLIISSMSVSVIIQIINNNDYSFYRILHPSPMALILKTLPYFWIIGMIIFVMVFHYTLRQVKGAYKIELFKIIIISIILSVILGGFFYTLGIGANIDQSLSRRSRFYIQVMSPCHTMWSQENQGMLSGRITTLIDQNNFDLKDYNQKQWRIIRDKSNGGKRELRKKISPETTLKPNLEIRVLGEKINENTFHAFVIKPAPNCPCSN